MTFMNEFISAGDYIKYGLTEIDRYYLKSDFKPHWTIDHDRDIYLRHVASGRDEFVGDYTYTFYRGGEVIKLSLHEKGETNTDLTARRNYALLTISLPPHLESERGGILADLKDALVARNGAGVYSSGITTHATFDF